MRPLPLDVRVNRGGRVRFKQPGTLKRKVDRLPATKNNVRVKHLGHLGVDDVHVDKLWQEEVHLGVGVGEESVADVVEDSGFL